jgi:UDP-glucose 4-epimerase
MRVLVTGAAGFIGSSLTDRLLSLGHSVVGVDNFSTGQPEFLEGAKANPNFTLRQQDLLDLEALVDARRRGRPRCPLRR